MSENDNLEDLIDLDDFDDSDDDLEESGDGGMEPIDLTSSDEPLDLSKPETNFNDADKNDEDEGFGGLDDSSSSNTYSRPVYPTESYADVSGRKFAIGGVGYYTAAYRLISFGVLALASVILGLVIYGIASIAGAVYLNYILYCILVGMAVTVLAYPVISLCLRRRKGDFITQQDYNDIYLNGKEIKDKKVIRAYRHFNGAYYAIIISIIVIAIVLLMEIGFIIGINI